MPISATDGCTAAHWEEVLAILSDAIREAGFEPNLVSHANESALIHRTIISNLYHNAIVVCDVSGKNSNVMFELGLRLAFDKPTLVIKDDATSYSFDTSPIEHLDYPRDLRFARIVEFKAKLADKIKATHVKATSDPGYTTFLKHFGEFTVAKIEEKEIPAQQYILEELKSVQATLERMARGPFASLVFADPDPSGSAVMGPSPLGVVTPGHRYGVLIPVSSTHPVSAAYSNPYSVPPSSTDPTQLRVATANKTPSSADRTKDQSAKMF